MHASLSSLSRLFLSIVCLAACSESESKSKATAQARQPAPEAAPLGGSQAEPVAETAKAEPDAPESHTLDAPAEQIETIEFPSKDGLRVTADLYLYQGPEAPFIVLFHQAGWSRGEYTEIAPRLGALGFNSMAVDQRSGKGVNGVDNQTFKRAAADKRKTAFLDALPDMRAALELVKTRYPKAKRIAWGSSYSSALVLWLAGEEPELMDAAVAFSPGEYFKNKEFVSRAAAKIAIPTFITSSRDEADKWKGIAAAIPTADKRQFVPKSAGNHGSRALWSKFSDSGSYWAAVQDFLQRIR